MGLHSVIKKPGIILGGFLSLATLSIMNTAYTNVLDNIKSELLLNYTWSGALMSSYFVGYTLGQIPWGLISDTFGSRKSMSLSIFGVSLSTLLFGYSNSVIMAITFRFLSGLLGAGIFVPSVKLVSGWFNSHERGTALGLLNIGGSAGLITASWMVPLLSISIGWKYSIRLVGMLGIILSLICFLLLKEREGVAVMKIKLTNLPFKSQNFWYLCFIQFIRLGSFYTFISWLPLVLKEEYGLSVIVTSSIMSILNVAGIISNPAGGIAADRYGERKVLMFGFFSLAVFVILFTFRIGGPALYFIIFMIGWFINLSRSPSFSIVPDLFGSEIAGSISGITNTFASLGALILPFTLGYFRDVTSSYDIGWHSVTILSLLAAGSMYLIKFQESDNL